MKELYREVWLELHPDKNYESIFQYADSVQPSGINDEIPPEMVEPLRQKFLAQGREIDARAARDNARHLKRFLSNN